MPCEGCCPINIFWVLVTTRDRNRRKGGVS